MGERGEKKAGGREDGREGGRAGGRTDGRTGGRAHRRHHRALTSLRASVSFASTSGIEFITGVLWSWTEVYFVTSEQECKVRWTPSGTRSTTSRCPSSTRSCRRQVACCTTLHRRRRSSCAGVRRGREPARGLREVRMRRAIQRDNTGAAPEQGW
jgi:hypothetical protein